MCLAVPGKVLSIDGSKAVADLMGNTREADITLLEDVSVGDFILIHAGFGIQKLDLEEARKTIKAFETIDKAMGENNT